MADERTAAVELAEYVRDMEQELRTMLTELALCVQQMSGVSDTHAGVLAELGQSQGRHADAASVQRVVKLTQASAAHFDQRLAQVADRLAGIEQGPSLADLELGIKDNAIAWHAGDEAWHKLIPLEQLRGPRGGGKGEKGDPGEAGPVGSAGAQGPKGDTGNAGANAPQVQIQYSVDGATAWHTTPTALDMYARFSTDGGSTWGSAAKIQGTGGGVPAGGTATQGLLKVDATDGNVAWKDVRLPPQAGKFAEFENDFFVRQGQSVGLSPLTESTLSGGSWYHLVPGTPNHPGIIEIRNSPTSGSGGYLLCGLTSFLIAGGEEYEFIFKVPSTTNSTSGTFGLGDNWTAVGAIPTDGAIFKIVGATLDTHCYRSGTSSDSAPYTITPGVWYRAICKVNSTATAVTSALYDCSTGALLWEETISNNIPTAVGNETGFGLNFTSTAGGTAQTIFQLDWVRMVINRALVR